jgi:hypothetical protein
MEDKLAGALRGHIELYICDGDYDESTGETIQRSAQQALAEYEQSKEVPEGEPMRWPEGLPKYPLTETRLDNGKLSLGYLLTRRQAEVIRDLAWHGNKLIFNHPSTDEEVVAVIESFKSDAANGEFDNVSIKVRIIKAWNTRSE